MKQVIAENVARDEINSWSEAFETEPNESMTEALLPAVTRGRIEFDESKEEFRVKLRKSVELENKEPLTHVSLREPTTEQTQKASRMKNDVAASAHLLSGVSGLPLGIINRIGQKDFVVLSVVMGFFG